MAHEHQGQCLHCSESNPYTELTCKRCNRWLPWATALQRAQPATTPLDAAPQAGNQAAQARNYLTRAQPVPAMNRVQQPAVPNLLAADHQYCIHCGTAHIKEAAYCPACGGMVAAPQVSVVAPDQEPSHKRPRLWGRSQPQPTLAQAMPLAMYGGAHQIYQPSVNVSVVTQQKTEPLGLFARLILFLFKCTLVLAFLGGVLAVLTSP